MMAAIHAEGFKSGDDEEDGGPAAIEREGKVDEYLVSPRLGSVIFLDNVIDVLVYNN